MDFFGKKVFVFLIFVYTLALSHCEDVIVNTENGKLKAKLMKDRKNGQYYSFLKIPYAKPPINELRFKPPQRAENWEGVRDGSEDLPKCVQDKFFNTQVMRGQEDCLYLNVHTPEPNANGELRDVMVYIHGGGFTIGSGRNAEYGAEYLMPKGVVLVTINYRLGIFGFLHSDELGIPGNMGLKDQVAALQWVQRNIKNFGGDPNKVTLFGESAGGAAVSLHVFSPMSKGLFQKAIIQSGSALNPWAQGTYNTLSFHGKSLPVKSLKELQEMPLKPLFEYHNSLLDPFLAIRRNVPFGFLIERGTEEPKFLPDTIENLAQSEKRNVAIFLGYNDDEGLLINQLSNCTLNPDLTFILPAGTNIPEGSEKEAIAKQKIFERYNIESPENREKRCNEMLADIYFIYGIKKTTDMFSKMTSEPVYLYTFSMNSEQNLILKMLKLETKGANHGDELGYLFKHVALPEFADGSREEQLVEKVVDIWTTFAKNGKIKISASEDWKTYGENENYCNINDQITCGDHPAKEAIAFWDEIYQLGK